MVNATVHKSCFERLAGICIVKRVAANGSEQESVNGLRHLWKKVWQQLRRMTKLFGAQIMAAGWNDGSPGVRRSGRGSLQL